MGLSSSLPVKQKITPDHFYPFHSGSTLRMRQGGSFHPRHKIPPETQKTGDWLSWVYHSHRKALAAFQENEFSLVFILRLFEFHPLFSANPRKKSGKSEKPLNCKIYPMARILSQISLRCDHFCVFESTLEKPIL